MFSDIARQRLAIRLNWSSLLAGIKRNDRVKKEQKLKIILKKVIYLYICNYISYVIQRLRKNCNNTYIKIVYDNNELHRQ